MSMVEIKKINNKKKKKKKNAEKIQGLGKKRKSAETRKIFMSDSLSVSKDG